MTLTKKDLTEALEITKKDFSEAMKATREDINEALKTTKEDLSKELATTRKDLDHILKHMVTKEDLKIMKNDLLESMRENNIYLIKKMDQKVDQSVDSLRVLIEDVRADIKFVLEVREPHEEKLQHHDQKLENHEKRLTTLEDYTYTKDRLKP